VRSIQVLAGVSVLLAFLLVRTVTAFRVSGDTLVLVQGAGGVVDCLRNGTFHGCNIVHFPLFQFIPAVLLQWNGAAPDAIPMYLAWLNWGAFAAMTALLWLALKEQVSYTVAGFALLVLLTSPLLPYAVETFNEPAAALVTLAFAVAVVSGHHPGWVFALAVLTAITKETAAPFLVLVGLLGLVRRRDPPPSKATYLFVLVAAVAIGTAINSAFNYFRYDSIFNLQTLAGEFRVDTLHQFALNFAGLWLSPNGGLIPFWPSFVLILLVVLAATRGADPWPARLLAVVLLGLAGGFAAWYAPHGWVAWGPRLLLPWLPAVLYLACYFYPAHIDRQVAFMTANRWRLSGVIVVLAASALPSVVEVVDPRVMMALFTPDSVFPQPAPIQQDRGAYFAYLNYLMWSKRSMLIDAYNYVLHPLFRDKLLLYVACIGVMVRGMAAGRNTRYRRPPAPADDPARTGPLHPNSAP
jgi:hypothetical protein